MTILGPNGTPMSREPTQEEVDAFDPEQFWLGILDTADKLCGAAAFAETQRQQFQTLARQGVGSDQILYVLGQMANDVAVLHMESHPETAVIDVESDEAGS